MWVEAQDSLPVSSGHHSASDSVAVTLGLDTDVTSNRELQKMLRAGEGDVKAGLSFLSKPLSPFAEEADSDYRASYNISVSPQVSCPNPRCSLWL